MHPVLQCFVALVFVTVFAWCIGAIIEKSVKSITERLFRAIKSELFTPIGWLDIFGTIIVAFVTLSYPILKEATRFYYQISNGKEAPQRTQIISDGAMLVAITFILSLLFVMIAEIGGKKKGR